LPSGEKATDSTEIQRPNAATSLSASGVAKAAPHKSELQTRIPNATGTQPIHLLTFSTD
jgi:hypothetical protein